jgi:uncharacterized protein (TIGR03000 family)
VSKESILRPALCALALVACWSLSGNQQARAEAGGAPVVITTVSSPDAKIWFDDFATEQSGQQRRFSSPALQSGRVYVYQVRMVTEGQTLEKSLKVRAGDRITLDFTGDEVRITRGEAAPVVAAQTQTYAPTATPSRTTTLGANTSNRFGALQQKH